MTPQEKRSTFSLASIYAFRMLGLFMILPIFSLHATQFIGANAVLVGVALGVYGLTQAIFQIPFGMASDRLGRKPVIIFGLIIFMLGSIIAACAHNIDTVIIGRALQGAGAIGSTLIALVADSTQEEHRLKAMSVIGMIIGLSFIIAMVLGPLLNNLVGLTGIFWFIALLALLGIVILISLVPTPNKKQFHLHRDAEPVLDQFKKTLKNPQLLRLNFGIFSLHASLMALFIFIPSVLAASGTIGQDHQWIVYLPVLIIACVLMLPFVIIAEAKRLIKPIFITAIIMIVLTEFLLIFFHQRLMSIGVILCLFFAAFTLLEAILPSLVAKIAPAGNKGTAMGFYSSSQFLGVFVGGAIGGLLFHRYGVSGVLLLGIILGLSWLLLALTMKNPPYLSSRVIGLKVENLQTAPILQAKLLKLKGVKEALVCVDEQAAYLKIDRKIFSEHDLGRFLFEFKK